MAQTVSPRRSPLDQGASPNLYNTIAIVKRRLPGVNGHAKIVIFQG
jgi:hypothetical protein